MKPDSQDNNNRDNGSETPEDRDKASLEQENPVEDLTIDDSGGFQTDESPDDLTAGSSSYIDVDESLYDELVGNTSSNDQLENIDNLYDLLMEDSPEDGPTLFSEPVLICLDGKEFEATLAEPFSPSDSTVLLLAEPDCPQTKYKINELDYLGLASKPKQFIDLGHKTVSEVLETIDGKSKKVEVLTGQSFDGGVFCHAPSKSSRFHYFYFLNNSIKLRYRAQRIGEILLELDLVTKQVLEETLVKQKNMRSFRIGQILAKLAKLPPKKVEQVLDRAWRNHTGSNRIFAGDILVKAGLVTSKQVDKAQEIQEKLRNKKLGDMLVEAGSISEEKLYRALAEKFRLPYLDLKTADLSDDAKSRLPRDLALELKVLPVSIRNGHLVLATSHPEITEATDVLRNQLGCPFDLTVAAPTLLQAALIKKYGN